MKVIAYSDKDGNVYIVYPAYGDKNRPEGDTDDALLARCAELSVPKDAVEASYIDSDTIPGDRSKRGSWKLVDGMILVGE